MRLTMPQGLWGLRASKRFSLWPIEHPQTRWGGWQSVVFATEDSFCAARLDQSGRQWTRLD